MNRLPLLTIFLLMTLCGCMRHEETNPPFFRAEGVAAWPDSLYIDSLVCHTSQYPDSIPAEFPAYTSDVPMGNALWRRGMVTIPGDNPIYIWLFGALADPYDAMRRLRTQVEEGMISLDGYPLVAPRMEWALAAWEVFCLTGDEEWLAEIRDILRASVSAVQSLSIAPDGLMRGQAQYLSPATSFYPKAWQPVDRFTSKALGVNASLFAAYKVLAQCAAALNLDDEAHSWDKAAQDLGYKINDGFWQPSLGAYGGIIYGEPWPVIMPAPDNFGNLLCALLGIATPEMSLRLSMSRPVAPKGLPLIYPSPSEAVFPPALQPLQAIAAARSGSDRPFMAALVASWIAQNSTDEGRPWPAVVTKGIFGMNFSPEGLTFSPFVPKEAGSRHRLSGLLYRDAVLDITLTGNGNRVASIMLDGTPLSDSHPLIPATLKGAHKIDITLANNTLPLRPVTIVPQPYQLPPPPKVRCSKDSVCHIAWQPDSANVIMVDGVEMAVTSSPDVNLASLFAALPPSPTHDIYVAADIATPGLYGFSAPAHTIGPADAIISIPATAITPRRPPRQITRPELAAQYIELAARHNTRITLYANIPVEGEYDICIHYSNGTAVTGLRTLSVNGREVGTLICPPNDAHGWIMTQPSTSVRASLPAGTVQLALTYKRSTTILLHSVSLIRR